MNTGLLELRPFPREEIIAGRVADDLDPLALRPRQWAEALGEPVRGMYFRNSDIPAEEQTEVFCFFNGSHLGVGVICHDYDKDTFIPGKDGVTWSADGRVGVDVILDPGLRREGTVILSMNPAGGRVQKAHAPGTPYYPYHWRNTCYIEDDYWAALCWVEFDDIGLEAADGDVWGFNVFRRDGGPGREYFDGVTLAPNFDGFKLIEENCRLRFGPPSALKGVSIDQRTPGSLKVKMSLVSDCGFERIRAELRPCVGDVLVQRLAPADNCECEFKHTMADRVMCELRAFGLAGGREEDLGCYRLHTPAMVSLTLDKPGHRYGPDEATLTATVATDDPTIEIASLDLFGVDDEQPRHVSSTAVDASGRAGMAIEDLPRPAGAGEKT